MPTFVNVAEVLERMLDAPRITTLSRRTITSDDPGICVHPMARKETGLLRIVPLGRWDQAGLARDAAVFVCAPAEGASEFRCYIGLNVGGLMPAARKHLLDDDVEDLRSAHIEDLMSSLVGRHTDRDDGLSFMGRCQFSAAVAKALADAEPTYRWPTPGSTGRRSSQTLGGRIAVDVPKGDWF